MPTQKAFPAALLLALVLSLPAFSQGAFPGTGSKADWLKANGFFAEGNKLLQSKRYADAAAKYEQATTIYPSDFHYWYNLGLAQKKKGDSKAASDALRKAIELKGDDWRSWKLLGNCLYKLGDTAGAKDAFQHGLSCAPPAAEAADMNRAIAACGN